MRPWWLVSLVLVIGCNGPRDYRCVDGEVYTRPKMCTKCIWVHDREFGWCRPADSEATP